MLSKFGISFQHAIGGLLVITSIGTLTAYLITHVKIAFGLPGHNWLRTLHLTDPRMKFYDHDPNPNVGYARHALALDENRAAFERVAWGVPHVWRDTGIGNPKWFEQIWFAGNHSDVGGSYLENESRLSDISLEWMTKEAIDVDLVVDWSVLQLFPSAGGMQHDECKSSLFKYAKQRSRDPAQDAPLHSSVMQRFALQRVLHYDEMRPYRPECLRSHNDLSQYY